MAKERQAKQRWRAHSTSADKEGKKIDAISQKAYSSLMSSVRITNYHATIGGCQLFLWEKLSTYLDFFHENKKALTKLSQTENICLLKQHISAGWHSTGSSDRAMASVVVWLSTALPAETRNRMEGLPFEGNFSLLHENRLATLPDSSFFWRHS